MKKLNEYETISMEKLVLIAKIGHEGRCSLLSSEQ